jgi:hypothetical protein
MDLQTRKLTFIRELVRIENEEFISELEEMLKNYHEGYGRKKISMEQFNDDIDKSLEDSKLNRGISAQDLKAKIKKWK